MDANTTLEIIENNCSYKMEKAYFLSHNGLGDNISNIGAVNFLLKYYNTIYFLCKDIYQDNVRLLFDSKFVIVIPFNSHNEWNDCASIISNRDSCDCFVSGCHTGYLQSHITHPEVLKYVKNTDYTVAYNHLYQFYNDIGLDLSIYVNYFDIPSNNISRQYYNDISNYKIIFLHTKGSNRSINLVDIIDLYKDNDEYIIICANENVYNVNNSKYEIAEKYVNKKVAYYIDIIKNSNLIYIINSCFSCIVYPLILSKRINPVDYIIYDA